MPTFCPLGVSSHGRKIPIGDRLGMDSHVIVFVSNIMLVLCIVYAHNPSFIFLSVFFQPIVCIPARLSHSSKGCCGWHDPRIACMVYVN